MNSFNAMLRQQQNEIHVMHIILIILGIIAVVMWTPLLIMITVQIYQDLFEFLRKQFKHKKPPL